MFRWLPPTCLAAIVFAGCDQRPRQSAETTSNPSALLASIPDHPAPRLDRNTASRFVALSIACSDQEYPTKLDVVFDGDDTLVPPRKMTPTFRGCFDWHSAVHGHWAMLRVLHSYPDLPEAAVIRQKLNAHLTQDNVAIDKQLFETERNGTFERPYGWGWLLRLHAEVKGSKEPSAGVWAAALQPLADLLASRMVAYLDRLSAPIRAGTHANTAFSLVHAFDYARAVEDARLLESIKTHALAFYGNDRACPTAYEPSGEDFISACLAEADLMRRILPQQQFTQWLDGFLPPIDSPQFKPLLAPSPVKDKKDPRIGHLIGLSFHRSWAMEGVAMALRADDPRREVLLRIARRHAHEASQQMFDSGYGGAHWLASFAVYASTATAK